MSTNVYYGSSTIWHNLQISTEFWVSVTWIYDLNLPLGMSISCTLGQSENSSRSLELGQRDSSLCNTTFKDCWPWHFPTYRKEANETILQKEKEKSKHKGTEKQTQKQKQVLRILRSHSGLLPGKAAISAFGFSRSTLYIIVINVFFPPLKITVLVSPSRKQKSLSARILWEKCDLFDFRHGQVICFDHSDVNGLDICLIQAEALHVILEFGLGFSLSFSPLSWKDHILSSQGFRMQKHPASKPQLI